MAFGLLLTTGRARHRMHVAGLNPKKQLRLTVWLATGSCSYYWLDPASALAGRGQC